MQQISVKKILPDENQPRKYFAADKMYALKQSIKKHGIKTPLTVEEIAKDKYLLVDGERRFRAALELGMKEVPCVVEAPKSETERLIIQFNIQEQHEAWTPIEKAMAIINLSQSLKASLNETCQVLGVSAGDQRRYVAFAELADKETFIKNEVPIDYAASIRSLKNTVHSIFVGELEKEFTKQDEKKLEGRIIRGIIKGTIIKKKDVTRIGDSFRKNPKLIEKFLKDDSLTPDGLFLEAKAAGAYHLRNVIQLAGYVANHGNRFLETKDVKVDIEDVVRLKNAVRVLKSIIDLAE